MRFIPLDLMETTVASREAHTLPLGGYGEGVHSTPHAFFRREADGSIPWVVSRTCDHAGGTLRQCDGNPDKALCPLHNWEFDFTTLSYSTIPNQKFEVIRKTSLPFSVAGDTLTYETRKLQLSIPEQHQPDRSQRTTASLRYLTHASVAFEIDGIRLIADPWFVGECLACGWWLKQPPKADAWEFLEGADLMYISHNHPDHLHAETLKRARRDLPIIVPEFASESVSAPLRDLGFTNIHALELKRLYRIDGTDMLVSILPTSDQREDSALFIAKGDFSAVLTVDCVGANHYVLPRDITLLLSNFASGSSGWPLCYDVLGGLDERAKIVTKNRGTAQLEVMKYLAATQPKAYMPYAGFFEERAPRDRTIREYNIKNPPGTIVEKVRAKFPDVLAVNPLEHDRVQWQDGKLTLATVDQPPLFTYTDALIEQYLAAQRDRLKRFDIATIARYFAQSQFSDQFILYLVLTDDDYVPNGESLRIDFSTQPIAHRVVDGAALVAEFEARDDLGGYHHLLLKARRDSMWRIAEEGRPLEELSLGFQCRIDRKPDRHNAAFWQHYTTYGAPMLARGEDRLLYLLLEGA